MVLRYGAESADNTIQDANTMSTKITELITLTQSQGNTKVKSLLPQNTMTQ